MSDRSPKTSPVRHGGSPSSRRANSTSTDAATSASANASASAFLVAENEEMELRKRVRDLRMAQLESEIKARRIEFLREDEQIRAEIIRLRKQLLEAASLSPMSSSSSARSSARSTTISTRSPPPPLPLGPR